MTNNALVSKRTQKILSKVAEGIIGVVFFSFLVFGCIDIETSNRDVITAIVKILVPTDLTLCLVAFFLNDVRRWFRIYIPFCGIACAWLYSVLHIHTENCKFFGRMKRKHHWSYTRMFNTLKYKMDDTWGEPENTYIV